MRLTSQQLLLANQPHPADTYDGITPLAYILQHLPSYCKTLAARFGRIIRTMEREFKVQEDADRLFSLRGLLKAIRPRRKHERWKRDGLPIVFDGFGPAALSASAGGGADKALGEIVKVELNDRAGRPSGEGLPANSVFKL